VDIYGQSSNPCLNHGEVYDGFTVTGSENILKVTARHQHLRLRRLVSHSFSTKALLESQPFMHRKLQEYLNNTMKIEDGQTADILEKTYELYLDIVSQLCFGQSFDCLSRKNPTARCDMMAFFEVVPILAFIPWIRYVHIPSLKVGVRGLDRLIEFSRANFDAHLVGGTRKSGASPEAKFLHNLGTAVDEETGTKLSTQEIVENAIIFLTAGAGTTAATTIFLIWECGRNEKVRSRLAEEIRAEFPDPNVAPSYEDACKLVRDLHFNEV
jgi:cytochrome P450